ncbi:MAG: hypothetical protein IKE22_11710, partial [Atopobiaceae bacterium]|nr:hypothetical protein [Atopobiaceae bacterium]
ETEDWQAAARKGGCVADRPYLEPEESFGRVVFRSWLPEGWTYQNFVPDKQIYGMSLMTPYVPGIRMTSPDGSSFISFITTNGYQDSTGSIVGDMMRAFGQGDWLDVGFVDPVTLIRNRTLVSAVDYCDEVVDRTGLDVGEVLYDAEPDDYVAEYTENVLSKMGANERASMWYDWARCAYEAQRSERPYAAVVETLIFTNGFNVGKAPMGAPRNWYTFYELVLACPRDQLETLLGEFERVRRSIELGPGFYARKQLMSGATQMALTQSQTAVNNAMSALAQQGAEHFDRMNQIVTDANQSMNTTMHQMLTDSAATNERIAGWQSETIREVNTFGGLDGRPVEASIKNDHVYGYQPGDYPHTDAYLGVEGDWLEPGTDFIELPRL